MIARITTIKGILCVALFGALLSCKSTKEKNVPADAEIIHQNQNHLTKVIIYDVFSTPVASRIYAYTSLAA